MNPVTNLILKIKEYIKRLFFGAKGVNNKKDSVPPDDVYPLF